MKNMMVGAFAAISMVVCAEAAPGVVAFKDADKIKSHDAWNDNAAEQKKLHR